MTRDHGAENARRRERYGSDAEYRERVRARNLASRARARIVREGRVALLFEAHLDRIRAALDPPEPGPLAQPPIHHEGCDCGPRPAVDAYRRLKQRKVPA